MSINIESIERKRMPRRLAGNAIKTKTTIASIINTMKML